MLGGVLITDLFGVEPKPAAAIPKAVCPKGSVLVFERVTDVGAPLNGSEVGVFGVSEEKFADHAAEPNGSSVFEEDTDEDTPKLLFTSFACPKGSVLVFERVTAGGAVKNARLKTLKTSLHYDLLKMPHQY